MPSSAVLMQGLATPRSVQLKRIKGRGLDLPRPARDALPRVIIALAIAAHRAAHARSSHLGPPPDRPQCRACRILRVLLCPRPVPAVRSAGARQAARLAAE